MLISTMQLGHRVEPPETVTLDSAELKHDEQMMCFNVCQHGGRIPMAVAYLAGKRFEPPFDGDFPSTAITRHLLRIGLLNCRLGLLSHA